MELVVISNYGVNIKIISKDTTVEQIIQVMNSIDWNNFHQVILSEKNGDWIEVGGNLSEDGLSSSYFKEENDYEFIIVDPPRDIEHMTQILVSYFNKDDKFKNDNYFK